MEQKFGINSIDIKVLREFCEREGKEVTYRKGDQLEREGDPARWFGFVTEGYFKYVTHGISDDKEHITWFSFEGEFAGDYPACLDGGPALTTIEAMVPTRIIRVSGEQLVDFFLQDAEKMELRSICKSKRLLLNFCSILLLCHMICQTPPHAPCGTPAGNQLAASIVEELQVQPLWRVRYIIAPVKYHCYLIILLTFILSLIFFLHMIHRF